MDIRTDVSQRSANAAAEGTEFRYTTERPADTPCGFLLDLAAYPDALRLLFANDPAPVYDMPWMYTRSPEEASAGPVLILPEREACREWLWASHRAGKALALYGHKLTLKTLCQHWVTLNTVNTPFGPSLFRYGDPASLGTLGPSLTALQRHRILGPLTAIDGHYGDPFRLLRHRLPAGDVPQPVETEPLTLTQNNLVATERFRKERLIRAFAETHGVPEALVQRWCQQLETLGAPSEQGLLEGMEVLNQSGRGRLLSDEEVSIVRNSSGAWSGRLETLAHMTHREGR
ncbi:hypothetical protein BTO32_16020 [Marinobacter lutaoensis]|uniref:DUF4123 domain-containing protein n=1 Tax=Marinobacter lutaoensis TaxID=135739 RepID=A0A1V2DNV5_9GAMM|nr:DUF4123 domain-containing protein [Marinobacter lutaoensis]ONF42297.1 hypothetical protein BTO32_16020 [Marinobacter lutaoensis]